MELEQNNGSGKAKLLELGEIERIEQLKNRNKMRNMMIFTLALLLCASVCLAQPAIEWQHSLGGSDYDGAFSIHQTGDGGYIVAGWSECNDGDVSGWHEGYDEWGYPTSDYWVVNLDSSGEIEWQRSLGGSSSDEAYSIHQTSDGGYIVAGGSQSNDGDVSGNHGEEDYWVVKLDTSGSIEWELSLGGSDVDRAHFIHQTNDCGYIVAGYSWSNDGDVSGNHGYADSWVVKLDSSGEIEWQRCLGGSDYDVARSIQQTGDGGYIVAGGSQSNDGDVSGHHGEHDYWVVKLDSSGSIEWQNCLGGSYYDRAYSIHQTDDNGYIVAGRSESNDGNVTGHHGTPGDYGDYWVVKLDTSGSIEWQRSLGGSYDDWAYSIHQTGDGGYIVAGVSWSIDGDVSGNHGYADYWVVKLNSSGEIEWQHCFGGIDWDWASSIQQTDDGGYIMARFSESNDGDVSGNHGDCDYWVVKLSPDSVGISEDKKLLKSLAYSIAAFPNPFNSSVAITAPAGAELEIYDLRGTLRLRSVPDAAVAELAEASDGSTGSPTNTRTFIWTPDETIASGIYIVKARTEDGGTAMKRVVLVR